MYHPENELRLPEQKDLKKRPIPPLPIQNSMAAYHQRPASPPLSRQDFPGEASLLLFALLLIMLSLLNRFGGFFFWWRYI